MVANPQPSDSSNFYAAGLQSYVEGNLEEAERTLKAGLEALQKHTSSCEAEAIKLTHLLANVSRDCDKFAEADRIYLRAINSDNGQLSKVLSLTLLRDHADSLCMQGRFAEAFLIERRRLLIAEGLPSKTSCEIIDAIIHLCALSRVNFDYKAAEIYYLRLLDHMENNLDSNHASLIPVLMGLGIVWTRQNKHEQAEAINKRALRLIVNQPDLKEAEAELCSSIGLSLCAQGQQQQAHEYCDRAASIRAAHFNDYSINDLADVYCAGNKLEDAQHLCEDASISRELGDSSCDNELADKLRMYIRILKNLNACRAVPQLEERISRLIAK